METRVQKYNSYRAKLMSEGVAEANKNDLPKRSNTQTLPITTVMDTLGDEKTREYYEGMKRNQIIKIALIALLAVAVIAGVVIFGIFAFTKGA